MREIKYKAWDKINRRWLNLWKIYLDITGLAMAFEEIDGESYGLHQVELVQYTGLHDKQGKEIYEGDIVRRYGEGKYRVYWHEFMACWCMTGRRGIDKGDMALACEVIGNTYENPELLEKK